MLYVDCIAKATAEKGHLLSERKEGQSLNACCGAGEAEQRRVKRHDFSLAPCKIAFFSSLFSLFVPASLMKKEPDFCPALFSMLSLTPWSR